VPAAGSGTRFGNRSSKLQVVIEGRTALQWSVGALADHPAVGCIVVAAPPAEIGATRAALLDAPTEPRAATERTSPTVAPASRRHSTEILVVAGGDTRCASVECCLRALPADVDVVLVHDAARPAVSQATISAVLEGVARWGAAVPGVPVADTLKRVGGDGLVTDTVSRDALWAVQTPQGAERRLLEEAYRLVGGAADSPTDEAGLLQRAGFTVGVVTGDPGNAKLTVPSDVESLRRTLADRRAGGWPETAPVEVRTGIGYDVHRLAPGLPLRLGGVEIPHSHGLVGHSDADVMMHAVCDAVLGAIGEADIGVLFPDSDERNRGRCSRDFVAEAASRVTAKRSRVINVDVTLLAEAPRIGRYRERMREAIADALGIRPDRVGVKATTNEGLGFVGRGEAIADALGIRPDRVGVKATTNEGLGFVGRGEGIGCWAVASVECPRDAGTTHECDNGGRAE